MEDAERRVYERVLILRCQGGDEGALAELIARYSPGVRFFLRGLVGRSGAEDLLQEVWFEVCRKINRLREPGAFAAWVYRIARDRAYRDRRRKRVGVVAIDEEVVEGVADEGEDEGFGVEEAERVRGALERLPAEQREVLVLRFVEGMGYEQIAEVVGRPVGTVRSRIHYAKRAVREMLGAEMRKNVKT